MHYRISRAALLLAALATTTPARAEPTPAPATARGTATASATVVSPCDIGQAPPDRCGSTVRTMEQRTVTVTVKAEDSTQDRTSTYRAVTIHFD